MKLIRKLPVPEIDMIYRLSANVVLRWTAMAKILGPREGDRTNRW